MNQSEKELLKTVIILIVMVIVLYILCGMMSTRMIRVQELPSQPMNKSLYKDVRTVSEEVSSESRQQR